MNFLFLKIAIITSVVMVVAVGLCVDESITITTYYPSPVGSYGELHADQMSIGSAYRQAQVNDGDLLVSGNIGVGTTQPNDGKGKAGYLDVKDIYLRDIHSWASELALWSQQDDKGEKCKIDKGKGIARRNTCVDMTFLVPFSNPPVVLVAPEAPAAVGINNITNTGFKACGVMYEAYEYNYIAFDLSCLETRQKGK